MNPLAAFHPSNALTYVSLVSAIAAIAGAAQGSVAEAGALIALSVVADTFDGRFARLFTRTDNQRALGVQLDSLSDAIAFGAAPCVCMTLLASATGWLAVLSWSVVAIFAACAISRLAFFNVAHDNVSGFVGLPVPVAALIWSSLLLFDLAPITSVVALFATAFAMILPVSFPRPFGAGLALFVLWPITVISVHLL